MAKARALPVYLLLAAPAGYVLYVAFNAGGYFPRETAIGGLIFAQIVVLYVMVAQNPFARLSWPAVAGVAAMAAFGLWILASQLWSDSPARSILEFNRALLYLLVLVICVLVGGKDERLRFAVRAMAAALAAVAIAALLTRVLPSTFP